MTPLDEVVRGQLRSAVLRAREALTADLEEILEGKYGVKRTGEREALARLPEVSGDSREMETREFLLKVLPAQPTTKAERGQFVDSFDSVLRSLAFTHLNRLVAFKLMEAPSRKLIREAIGRGAGSNGFKFFLAADSREEGLYNSGRLDEAYRHFLLHLAEDWHREIGVLFDPNDLPSRVFPRPPALKAVLDLINQRDLAPCWDHEETLGWVYQYYTPKELREKARKESAAPRNSYEMAFRNQFFTPDYVVRFLVENSLGRTWFEMKPDTALRDICSYLAIRPEEAGGPTNARPKKDPRLLRIIDPACGSGHFLLYAFELLLVIYREAWDDPDLGPVLAADFDTREAFDSAIPKLIVEENLHGIDIDPRAIQIAALVLLLKAKSVRKDIRIEKSHLVCAEPMPGDRAMLEAFKARKLKGKLGVVARVLDGIWDFLRLAGDAGSLLKAEETIVGLVEREREEWKKRPALFPEMLSAEQASLDFSDITDDASWGVLESRVEKLLVGFAEEAEGAEGAYRRVFARDGIEGLRFLEVLGRKYDVVLMNPPFGAPTSSTKEMIERAFPDTSGDVYACFIERGLRWLVPGGKLGFITNRTWLGLPQFEGLRTRVLGPLGAVEVGADLGSFVLEAQVETVAAVIGQGTSPTHRAPWIRLLKTQMKELVLGDAIARYSAGETHRSLYQSSQERFARLPSGVFGYWMSDQLASRMGEAGSVAARGVEVAVGLQTSDDFRFLRLAWEVPPALIGLDRRWAFIAKGGEYSPFFDDVHLVVKWQGAGVEVASFEKAFIRNARLYGRPGVTWPARTTSPFGPRALPAACTFGHKGPAAMVPLDGSLDPHVLLGVLASRPSRLLLSVRLGAGDDAPGSAAKSYEVGLIRDLPFPPLASAEEVKLREAAISTARARKALKVSDDETTSAFLAPGLLVAPTAASIHAMVEGQVRKREEIWRLAVKGAAVIDEVVCQALNFSDEDRAVLAEELEPGMESLSSQWDSSCDDLLSEAYLTKDPIAGERLPGGEGAEVDVRVKTRRKKQPALRSLESLARLFEVAPDTVIAARRRLGLIRSEDLTTASTDLVSFLVGAVFGRWDIRLVGSTPELELFAPMGRVSSGALVGSDGMPEAIAPPGYPLPVDFDGVLVNDAGHSDDIVGRVREAFHLVFKDNADAIEQEVCSILKLRSFRDWFTRTGTGGFWVDHVRRYSKSRRRAPIYWLLQSPRGLYQAWLYIHRLDRDTLFKLLGPSYLGGKLTRARQELSELRPGGSLRPGLSRMEEARVEELETLLIDLEDFAAKLKAITELRDERGTMVGWKPDLDDGVVLCASPLHEVIPWPIKRKIRGRPVSELEVYWDQLRDGTYDWAKVAMLYWPDRVREKCRRDKSLAIAHDLDGEFFPGLMGELRRKAERVAAGSEDEVCQPEDADEIGDEEDEG